MSHEDEVGDEVEEGEDAMQPQDLTPARSQTQEGETPLSPTHSLPWNPCPSDHHLGLLNTQAPWKGQQWSDGGVAPQLIMANVYCVFTMYQTQGRTRYLIYIFSLNFHTM